MTSIHTSLLQWLSTFKLDGQPSIQLKDDTYYILADGHVCARILNQICPQYFSDKWLDGIKPVPPNGSWRLRVSNLKRILQKIHDYASDIQNPQFQLDTVSPDVAVIAQNFDSEQISRLIQLILFCAINCEKKQDYIEVIRNLPTEVKQDIKEAIEELLVKDSGGATNRFNTSQNESARSDNQSETINDRLFASSASHNQTPEGRRNSKSSLDTSKRSGIRPDDSTKSESVEDVDNIRRRLSNALIISEEKAQACHDLELKIRQLQVEKEHLLLENEKLLNERKFVTSSTPKKEEARPGDSGISAQTAGNGTDQSQKYRREIQTLKEEIIKLESDKEDHRLKNILLKNDLDKISKTYADLQDRAESARRLQDELDEHRQMSEKVVNQEITIQNLITKNSDMKREFQVLEEKVASYIEKCVKLEQENAQLNNSASQIKAYKKQLQESQMQLTQETHRAEKAEAELVRLAERHSATKQENERLYQTANQLIRTNSSRAISSNNVAPSEMSSSDNTLALVNRVEELQRALFQKEHELAELDAKYKRNIQKAKKVVETLNNSQSAGSSHQVSFASFASSLNSSNLDEINILKQQLKDREERIIELDREFCEFKKIKHIHERLMMSAFYGLTIPMQWKSAEQRLGRTTLTSPPNTAASSMSHSKHSHHQ